MISVVIAIILVLIVIFLVCYLIGLKGKTIATVLGITLTLSVFVNAYLDSQNTTVYSYNKRSTDKIIQLLDRMKESIPVWQELNGNPIDRSPGNDITLIQTLKFLEGVHLNSELNKFQDEDNDMWMRVLNTFFKSDYLRDVLDRYSYMFQDSTVQFFKTI